MQHIRDLLPAVMASIQVMERPSVYNVDRNEEKAFVESPTRWPRFPFLPMKRRTPHEAQTVCGLILARTAGESNTFVVECNLHEAEALEDMTDAEIKNNYAFHRYASVDELLADGWVVD